MQLDLAALATKHITDILNLSIQYDPGTSALVVFDTENGLARILTEAYRAALPDARFVDFDEAGKEGVIAAFDEMKQGDLVVLIQSSNFLLNEFRIRLHLFNKGLKVIEHMHLYRNSEDVWDVYINALEYDAQWYRTVGPALKEKLDGAGELQIACFSTENSTSSSLARNDRKEIKLVVSGSLESAKLNIGDYTGMDNVGGTFPIGEVFTEARDFSTLNGSIMIYAFAGADFSINMHEPFRVDITNGLVTGWGDNTPQSFIDIISLVKEYERPLIREIGFGLNRAITRERYLQDITAFERIYGMHFSLGEKHSVYKKEGITTNKTKFHIDLFPVVDTVLADGAPIFKNNQYLV